MNRSRIDVVYAAIQLAEDTPVECVAIADAFAIVTPDGVTPVTLTETDSGTVLRAELDVRWVAEGSGLPVVVEGRCPDGAIGPVIAELAAHSTAVYAALRASVLRDLHQLEAAMLDEQDVSIDGPTKGMVAISASHASHDEQVADAMMYLAGQHPDVYARLVDEFPEWTTRMFAGAWFDTTTMGVSGEWPLWLTLAIEDTGIILWDDGEPFANRDPQ
jgi:hypothetical protein